MRYPRRGGGAWKSLPEPSCYPATEPPLFSNKYKAFPPWSAIGGKEIRTHRLLQVCLLLSPSLFSFILSRRVFYVFARGLRKTATTKTYRRLMAAYSVSGRVSTGSRRGARLSLRTTYRSRRLSLSRQAVTERETSPLTPYAIPFHAPIGNSYSDPIFTDLRLLVIHSIEPLNSFCYCRFIFHAVLSPPRAVNIIASFNSNFLPQCVREYECQSIMNHDYSW